MFTSLPKNPQDLLQWEWSQFEPYARTLVDCPLNKKTLNEWLADWSSLSECIDEYYNRLYVGMTLNTADQGARQRFDHFMDTIYPAFMDTDQKLKLKLLSSGLEPDGFQIQLRNIRAEADLFRSENLPNLAEEQKMANDFDKILGAQSVILEGTELTITQLLPIYRDPDRSKREQAWKLGSQRQLADRPAINDLWKKLLSLRTKIASTAGRPDYRTYRWQQLLRFDYTPEDCYKFHQAIEDAVVPVATRIYKRRSEKLGTKSLRPWDVDVDALGRPALKPFKNAEELQNKIAAIFRNLDPTLGANFETMIREGLLDLENRKNKGDGAYCASFNIIRKPFIFANVVGIHYDVQTVLHEGGHAMHVFESAHLPYFAQLGVPSEFAEVASMGMELLGFPYFTEELGGFYTPVDAARAQIEHLEANILFWPYMAMVDAFQHWVYENPERASDSANCDARWVELSRRFMPGIDWSGLEDAEATGWQRKHHIHTLPFYYVEYGLALLGAMQVWGNSLKDQPAAVTSYRQALSLGGTVALPQLYQAAGARLAFDAPTLKKAVDLAESVIEELENA